MKVLWYSMRSNQKKWSGRPHIRKAVFNYTLTLMRMSQPSHIYGTITANRIVVVPDIRQTQHLDLDIYKQHARMHARTHTQAHTHTRTWLFSPYHETVAAMM